MRDQTLESGFRKTKGGDFDSVREPIDRERDRLASYGVE